MTAQFIPLNLIPDLPLRMLVMSANGDRFACLERVRK